MIIPKIIVYCDNKFEMTLRDLAWKNRMSLSQLCLFLLKRGYEEEVTNKKQPDNKDLTQESNNSVADEIKTEQKMNREPIDLDEPFDIDDSVLSKPDNSPQNAVQVRKKVRLFNTDENAEQLKKKVVHFD